ncbi:MAG: hypothetical protein KF729_28375 [Sandaracinaceae bacterium]|nr:hypothetical protein [Sandaracinaceae bacterium]
MSLHAALAGRPALAEALARAGVRYAQLEASVRAGESFDRARSDRLRSDRVMIERAPPGALDAVCEALGVSRGGALEALEARIAALGVPRIVGWDGGRGWVKLYANASDAPEATRAALGAHVIGVNVSCDGTIEEKRYLQRAGVEGLGPGAARLARAAGALAAGFVESRDARGLRAVFVALRPASPEALDAAFGPVLAGFSWRALAAASPFPPASPRSIGIAAGRLDAWTAYIKPRDADAPALYALEPSLHLRVGAAEVAVYLAPAGHDARAYAVVGAHAVSYRVLTGAPEPASLRDAMERVVAALREDGSLERLARALD